MRNRFESQMRLGVNPIEKIVIRKGRDAQVAVLQALQWVFCTPQVNEEVFQLLESKLTDKQKNLGRSGMDLWTILVFGVMRLTRNQSYDDLCYSSNNDLLMREMVGIGRHEEEPVFRLTTIKENVSILTDDLLAEINAIIVKHGQALIQKKTKSNSSKQTATFLKPTSISRLISILPSMPREKASSSAPPTPSNTALLAGGKPATGNVKSKQPTSKSLVSRRVEEKIKPSDWKSQ